MPPILQFCSDLCCDVFLTTQCLQSDSMSGAVDPERDLDYLHLHDTCPTLPRGGALCGTSPSSVLDTLAFVSEALVDQSYCDKVRTYDLFQMTSPLQWAVSVCLPCESASPVYVVAVSLSREDPSCALCQPEVL